MSLKREAMKILIFTLGSRGDVQPYLALAVGLQQAGHREIPAENGQTPLTDLHITSQVSHRPGICADGRKEVQLKSRDQDPR